MRRFSFQKGEAAGRTSAERLAKLDLASAGVLLGMAPAPLEIQARHDAAFDVESVTREFFRDYKLVFQEVEGKVKIKDADERRLWTQRLFNRLMFMRFLEKKGWLEYDGDTKYLSALFKAAKKSKQNFLEDRLYFAFFYGLNTPNDTPPDGYESAYAAPPARFGARDMEGNPGSARRRALGQGRAGQRGPQDRGLPRGQLRAALLGGWRG